MGELQLVTVDKDQTIDSRWLNQRFNRAYYVGDYRELQLIKVDVDHNISLRWLNQRLTEHIIWEDNGGITTCNSRQRSIHRFKMAKSEI